MITKKTTHKHYRLLVVTILFSSLLSLLTVSGCFSEFSVADGAASIDTLPYTHIGDTIFPIRESADYTYKFISLNGSGKITSSKNNFNLHIEQDSSNQNIFQFSMLDQRKGNILLWKGNGIPEDSMGIYIIGTYDTTLDSINMLPAPIFWLPQKPTIGIRNLTEDQTIEYLGDNHSFLITPKKSDEIVVDDALLFKEEFQNRITYYYLQKGVGLLGWEKYTDSTLIEMGTLSSMNYERER